MVIKSVDHVDSYNVPCPLFAFVNIYNKYDNVTKTRFVAPV